MDSADRQQDDWIASSRQHVFTYNPGVFAHLPYALEAEFLEQFDSATEQETTLGLAACGDLGDGFRQTASLHRDLLHCAFQRQAGNALAAVPFVNKEAGDPPVGPRGWIVVQTPSGMVTRGCRSSALPPQQTGPMSSHPVIQRNSDPCAHESRVL